ncbi:hypothetical protein PEC18_33980 [Paucibacter sp. O1-1]|nr:hypothetical protein [Paucibacter sp. O1-1]MDA3830702.1 hypothetical protein [Paucibacter sp. O1-1]
MPTNSAAYNKLDVIINNGGVYKVPQITSIDNLDVRFVVNRHCALSINSALIALAGQHWSRG